MKKENLSQQTNVNSVTPYEGNKSVYMVSEGIDSKHQIPISKLVEMNRNSMEVVYDDAVHDMTDNTQVIPISLGQNMNDVEINCSDDPH